jgi:hypothetical protein
VKVSKYYALSVNTASGHESGKKERERHKRKKRKRERHKQNRAREKKRETERGRERYIPQRGGVFIGRQRMNVGQLAQNQEIINYVHDHAHEVHIDGLCAQERERERCTRERDTLRTLGICTLSLCLSLSLCVSLQMGVGFVREGRCRGWNAH